MNNVIFITNVKAPFQNCSSTDIMTNNIIHGLVRTGNSISLILLIDTQKEISALKKFYEKKVSHLLFLPRYFRDGQSKYTFVFGSLFTLLSNEKYKKNICDVSGKMDYPDIIIANKVTIDEIVYGNLLKKHFPKAKYYQYWSDPMALSGILPQMLRFNLKRIPFRIIEQMAIMPAERIIYGTEVLLYAQRMVYPKYAYKMRYIDICYYESLEEDKDYVEHNQESGVLRLIYAGNFYSRIRNIEPLLETVSGRGDVILDIYGTGDIDGSFQNVVFKHRIPPAELDKIKIHYDCEICLLNHSCLQIPGKLFYNMYSRLPILVICDGPYQTIIAEYIMKYKRFLLCQNSEESISSAFEELKNTTKTANLEYLKRNYSNKKIANDLILGGINGRT